MGGGGGEVQGGAKSTNVFSCEALSYAHIFAAINALNLFLIPSSPRKPGGGFTFEVQQLMAEDLCRGFEFETFAWRIVVGWQRLH